MHDLWHLVETPLKVPKQCRWCQLGSFTQVRHYMASRHGKKNPCIFFFLKKGHVTKNSGVCKFFWGTQKIFGDQQNVFGADLRKNGEPKVNLGSGENIFRHLFFFWGLKKIFLGVENVSAHIINVSAHKIYFR